MDEGPKKNDFQNIISQFELEIVKKMVKFVLVLYLTLFITE